MALNVKGELNIKTESDKAFGISIEPKSLDPKYKTSDK